MHTATKVNTPGAPKSRRKKAMKNGVRMPLNRLQEYTNPIPRARMRGSDRAPTDSCAARNESHCGEHRRRAAPRHDQAPPSWYALPKQMPNTAIAGTRAQACHLRSIRSANSDDQQRREATGGDIDEHAVFEACSVTWMPLEMSKSRRPCDKAVEPDRLEKVGTAPHDRAACGERGPKSLWRCSPCAGPGECGGSGFGGGLAVFGLGPGPRSPPSPFRLPPAGPVCASQRGAFGQA